LLAAGLVPRNHEQVFPRLRETGRSASSENSLDRLGHECPVDFWLQNANAPLRSPPFVIFFLDRDGYQVPRVPHSLRCKQSYHGVSSWARNCIRQHLGGQVATAQLPRCAFTQHPSESVSRCISHDNNIAGRLRFRYTTRFVAICCAIVFSHAATNWRFAGTSAVLPGPAFQCLAPVRFATEDSDRRCPVVIAWPVVRIGQLTDPRVYLPAADFCLATVKLNVLGNRVHPLLPVCLACQSRQNHWCNEPVPCVIAHWNDRIVMQSSATFFSTVEKATVFRTGSINPFIHCRSAFFRLCTNCPRAIAHLSRRGRCFYAARLDATRPLWPGPSQCCVTDEACGQRL